MTFQVGDTVVVVTDESNTVKRVKMVHDDSDITLDGDLYTTYGEHELKLVRSINEEVEVPTPVVPNTPTRTYEDIHDDIQKMFVQLIQYYEKQEVDKKLDLRIEAEYFPGSNDITVKFIACVGYGKDIQSRSLFKSVQLACDRFREDEAIKPKEIPFYKPAE